MSLVMLGQPEETAPLFRRIEAAMRERVMAGTWAQGQALPSRSRLCAEFATTRVTLDKAIQELVRDGLLHSVKGRGTFVAQPARKQTSASSLHFSTAPRTLRVGVVLERTALCLPPEEGWADNFYFGPLFQGIRDSVAGQAVEMLYSHLNRDDYGRFSRESSLDGMILIAPSRDDLPILHELNAQQVTFVAVGISSSEPEDSVLPCVDTDNRLGAAEAVRHLVGLGHRRIALVNLATAHSNHHDRLQGYQRAMRAINLTIASDDLLLFPTYDKSTFEERIEDWYLKLKSSGPLPTALFASDYMMALATLRVLRRHGRRVPEDISLVSFDDPLSAAHLTPPLTTIRQPVYRLGCRAVQRLLQALRNDSRPHGMEILPTELIVRESTCRATPVSAMESGLLREL